jgi:hypothetical protein
MLIAPVLFKECSDAEVVLAVLLTQYGQRFKANYMASSVIKLLNTSCSYTKRVSYIVLVSFLEVWQQHIQMHLDSLYRLQIQYVSSAYEYLEYSVMRHSLKINRHGRD